MAKKITIIKRRGQPDEVKVIEPVSTRRPVPAGMVKGLRMRGLK